MATAKPLKVSKAGRPVGAFSHFLGGTAGGIAGIILAYPLDTIKVRMQTQPHPPIYNGLGDCAMTMLRKEGVGSFYKGILSPIAGVAFIKAIAFGANGYFQNLIRGFSGDPTRQLNVGELALASSAAGVVTSFAVAPFERVKCAIQANNGMYRGVTDCARQLVAEKGFMNGLYRGTGLTIMREAPSYGLYFVTYDLMKRNLQETGNGSPVALAVAGGLAGVICWLPIYPIDVLKTRIQASGQYSGIVDCAVRSYRQEGARVFFRGLSATILRSFPMHATVFCTYEFTIRLLEGI